MRNWKFLVSIIAICAVLVSCNKEGQFNPKKKISKISYSEMEKDEFWDGISWITEEEELIPAYVGQVWNWNGKKLESIDYYDEDGMFVATDNFSYNGKCLSTISWSTGRYDFIYEKGKLSSIEYYYGDTKSAVYDITHDGKKISKITYTVINSVRGAEIHPLPSCILGLNLPTPKSKHSVALADPKGSTTYEFAFEWNGNNVSNMVYTTPLYSARYSYTYDNKLNPFYGLWNEEAVEGEFDIETGFSILMSKNNIAHCTVRDEDESFDLDYTYTYQGNYPTSATMTYTELDEDDVEMYRYTYSATTMFEY